MVWYLDDEQRFEASERRMDRLTSRVQRVSFSRTTWLASCCTASLRQASRTRYSTSGTSCLLVLPKVRLLSPPAYEDRPQLTAAAARYRTQGRDTKEPLDDWPASRASARCWQATQGSQEGSRTTNGLDER